MEVLLQTHLFAGFPRTINALATVRRIGVREGAENWKQHTDSTRWQESGEKTCETIYGRGYDKLRQQMKQLHPILDAMMVPIPPLFSLLAVLSCPLTGLLRPSFSFSLSPLFSAAPLFFPPPPLTLLRLNMVTARSFLARLSPSACENFASSPSLLVSKSHRS
mmetsp:Transcript_46110/g.144655  ORF Transcript_46110/g.144655 Transcript_46110/m.144655 type:complete len:163 (-) Transcript_46110:220-708(-)